MRIRRVLFRPALMAGSLIVVAFAVVALAAPSISPTENPDAPYFMVSHGVSRTPKAPGGAYPLGLMARQYDIFYGVVWGTRLAFQAGLMVTAGRLIIGVVVGLLAGYFGGWVDALLMRITDAFLAFPIMAAGMVMIVILGRQVVEWLWSTTPFVMPYREEEVLMLTLVLFGWMSYARLIRGNLLAQREKEYIEAARAAGVGHVRMMLRHLWPNARQGLFVLAASDVGVVVVLLAMFAFVGLITPAPEGLEADWGQMLAAARGWIVGTPGNAFEYWYTYLPVSLAIVLFSVGWNLVGDGLRDALDPRLR
ncbi:MAG: ABC transporter permease [Anaerolineae bacterium]|nr:ABC transporter permease [Anaerolineae bacterium]